MRILHTADWHLGLRLYKKELHEEHKKFFAWLVDLISERRIDVLLISGDVFDQANPSNETRKLYYDFLKQLIHQNCLVIITGGNHDSPGILNAPKEILHMLQVYVVGNVPDQMEDQVFEILEKGEIVAVIAAVPYIREYDIHRFTEGETFDDKRKQVSAGIRNHYAALEKYCLDKYGVAKPGLNGMAKKKANGVATLGVSGVTVIEELNGNVKTKKLPIIAMGHLYAAGATTSESEREIQIGYQSPVTAEDFPEGFDYVALGHIHRPQFIAGQDRIRYSGSPIALSFSEKNDRKIVIELDISGDGIKQIDHAVPAFRKLVRFSGSFEKVKAEVERFTRKGSIVADDKLANPRKSKATVTVVEKTLDLFSNIDEAKAWAELQIIEEVATPAIQSAVSNFVADFESEEIEILNHRITSTAASLGINDLVEDHTQLEDLKPAMVLTKMMESESFSDEQRAMIMQAFLQLTEMEEEDEEE